MAQRDDATSWKGWELWYFGGDYVEATGLRAEHWSLDTPAGAGPGSLDLSSAQPNVQPTPQPPAHARATVLHRAA